jgi:predicted ATP-dependent serine protease
MLGIQSIDDVEVPDWLNEYMPFGIPIIDEFINGSGIIPSQVISLSASRGTGKTTLMLQCLHGYTRSNIGKRALYISREEPSIQLKKTASRINVGGFDIVGDESECTIEDIKDAMSVYSLIVLDSLSCLATNNFDDKPIKELKSAAKETKCALINIVHQTKSGEAAGSTHIGHLVDTVIDIERGDPETFGDDKTRIIKMDKNRFGACGQLILKLERSGWDFENPVDVKTANEENKTEAARNSAQAKKPKELADIMAIAATKGRFTFADINHLIPADDAAAIGRFERHLKELEKYSKLIVIGRGKDKIWEIVK